MSSANEPTALDKLKNQLAVAITERDWLEAEFFKSREVVRMLQDQVRAEQGQEYQARNARRTETFYKATAAKVSSEGKWIGNSDSQGHWLCVCKAEFPTYLAYKAHAATCTATVTTKKSTVTATRRSNLRDLEA